MDISLYVLLRRDHPTRSSGFAVIIRQRLCRCCVTDSLVSAVQADTGAVPTLTDSNEGQ